MTSRTWMARLHGKYRVFGKKTAHTVQLRLTPSSTFSLYSTLHHLYKYILEQSPTHKLARTHTHRRGKRKRMKDRVDTGASEVRKRKKERKERSVSEQERAKLRTMNTEREREREGGKRRGVKEKGKNK